METAEGFAVALVTVPNIETGRKLATLVLEGGTAACVNLLPGLESHYWWEGKLDKSKEVLMIIKTTREELPNLERLILSNHPYDTAEFLVLSLETGSEKYLKWLRQSVD